MVSVVSGPIAASQVLSVTPGQKSGAIRPGTYPERVEQAHTTTVIQGYLDQLGALRGDAPAEPVVRALLERAVGRLELLCATLLFRSYPRLARPPLNLRTDELLGGVVERLIKAMREARPGTVRQFFAIAHQHMRWELNDLARRLDGQVSASALPLELAATPLTSGSPISDVARRMFDAIENLPDEEREVFSLVRIDGMSLNEAAEVVGVSAKTVQRRMARALILLSDKIGDLRPDGVDTTGSHGSDKRTMPVSQDARDEHA